MSVSNDRSANGNSRYRPFQFSLRQLLALPAVLALYLGIFIAGYPFTVTAIPAVIVCLALFAMIFRNTAATIILGAFAFVGGCCLVAGVTDPSEYARQSMCRHNISQIMLALHNYYDRNGNFPPAYIADKDGRPMHSWRVLILPYMEHDDVFRQYRMDEPWDGPNNRKLWDLRIPEYECPEQPDTGVAITSYVAVTGPGTMWPGAESTRIEEFGDETSQTIAIVEIANSGIHWMEPRDLEIATLPMAVNPQKAIGVSSLHREVSWQQRRLGAHVGMADGSIRFLPTDFSGEKLKAMLTIGGGEKIEDEPIGR